MNYQILHTDGSLTQGSLTEKMDRETRYITVPDTWDFPQIESIDLMLCASPVPEGTEGYLVFPTGQLGYFHGKQGIQSSYSFQCLPIFGWKVQETCVVGKITGMRFDSSLMAAADEKGYRWWIRIDIQGRCPWEPIGIVLHTLQGDDANYSGMARWYRNLQLQSGACVPLSQRMNETLKYTMESLYIRIRQAWKPAPPKVMEQTPENEPEMRIACTFEHVARLMEACQAQGISKAEFCLVGWNRKGHDGRWPQIFPVEEELGGEEKLRELIKRAEELGYHMVCHTNSTDGYSVAENWSWDLAAKDRAGSPVIDMRGWSGGRMVHLCPQKAWELAKRDLPRVAELGFHGTHYIDVMTTVTPQDCWDPNHLVNRRESVEYQKKIMALSRELFGGFSSEGGFDFACDMLDFALYISFARPFNLPKESMEDCCIPLWQLVYHGIILSNPFTCTINAPVKEKKFQLKALEYGARPSIYFYSKFKSEGGNWMGDTDFLCGTAQEIQESVSKLKALSDEYRDLAYLQPLFMERHEEIAPDVFATTYSDGSVMTVDYAKETWTLKRGTLA